MSLAGSGPALALSALLVISTCLYVGGLAPDWLPDLAAAGMAGLMIHRALVFLGLHAAAPVGALVAFAVLAGVEILYPALRYMPFLLIALVHVGLAWIFAEGLRMGREPILLRLVRLMGLRELDDPRFVRFMRGQCGLWSVAALATATLSFWCMLGAAGGALLTTLFWVQMIWFWLSHEYARWRYGRPETWWMTLQAMTRPGIWPRLVAR